MQESNPVAVNERWRKDGGQHDASPAVYQKTDNKSQQRTKWRSKTVAERRKVDPGLRGGLVADLPAEVVVDGGPVSVGAVVDPKKKWWYKDPTGAVQGPFDTEKMREWYKQGFFKNSLPIRCDENTPFVDLGDWFKDEMSAFLEKVPENWKDGDDPEPEKSPQPDTLDHHRDEPPEPIPEVTATENLKLWQTTEGEKAPQLPGNSWGWSKEEAHDRDPFSFPSTKSIPHDPLASNLNVDQSSSWSQRGPHSSGAGSNGVGSGNGNNFPLASTSTVPTAVLADLGYNKAPARTTAGIGSLSLQETVPLGMAPTSSTSTSFHNAGEDVPSRQRPHPIERVTGGLPKTHQDTRQRQPHGPIGEKIGRATSPNWPAPAREAPLTREAPQSQAFHSGQLPQAGQPHSMNPQRPQQRPSLQKPYGQSWSQRTKPRTPDAGEKNHTGAMRQEAMMSGAHGGKRMMAPKPGVPQQHAAPAYGPQGTSPAMKQRSQPDPRPNQRRTERQPKSNAKGPKVKKDSRLKAKARIQPKSGKTENSSGGQAGSKDPQPRPNPNKDNPFGGQKMSKEFETWCREQLKSLSPGGNEMMELVKYLMSLTKEDEIRDTIKFYLEDSPQVREFADGFLVRKDFDHETIRKPRKSRSRGTK